MGLVKGGFLRLSQTFLYVLAFCCAAIILGIYSYFLAYLADRNLHIATWEKAVEGLSGAAVLYTICAVLLTCCLAGIAFFSFLALVLDLLFMGAMIAIAVLTRHGASSCKGTVNTPLGVGASNTSSPNLGLACRLNTACFAVAIIGAFLFLVTALMQIVLARNHKKEKRVGPSPNNNYTSGYSDRKFWQRKQKPVLEKDAELGTTGTGLTPVAATDLRPSHDTSYTGATVAAPQAPFVKKELQSDPNPQSMYANMDREPSGIHAPHVGWTPHNGTVPASEVNPYGYETTIPARNF